MKLEPDLIKEILQWCEDNLPENPEKLIRISNFKFNQYSINQITFHTKLLYDNGYIECIDVTTNDSEDYIILNLTMNGYQYLSLLKSKAWNTAKGVVHDFGVIFAEAAIRAVIDKVQLQI
jgi:hypothetical protein